MKIKGHFRLITFILALCTVLTSTLLPISAVTDTEGAVNTESFVLPDIIDEEEAVQKGYVGRDTASEKDLNTFVFENADGTSTMRIFSHPVKYLDKNGVAKDISLKVQSKLGGGFKTLSHEIETTFERRLTDGISLEYNDVDVKLIPELPSGISPTATVSSDSKVVSYRMNDLTSYVYQLTYAGFKEDIVVKEYTGQTAYHFTVHTNGLKLCEEYGSYYLADEDGNAKATIGEIIVFTADERNNTMGSMTYTTVRENQEYLLTIHLDAEYLADEKTHYPIRIDPTIEVTYANSGAGAIEDVTINETDPFSGTSGALNIGRHNDGTISRALMRFPDLSLSGILPDQITAATVELRDLMCQGDEDIWINCHIYKKTANAWSESQTTTWQSVGNDYLGNMLDSKLISYGQGNVTANRYGFNIIAAARAWADGSQSPDKGLVFKASDDFEGQTGSSVNKWYKIFASYNRSSNKPSLSFSYNNLTDADTITLNTATQVVIANPTARKIFKFIPSTTGFYTFSSSYNSSCDPNVYLYNANYESLSYNDDGEEYSNFKLTYHLMSGKTYYISAGCYGSDFGTYNVTVSNCTSDSDISTVNLSFGCTVSENIDTAYSYICYKITPSASTEYLFFSSNRSGDPRIWLYSYTLYQMNGDDNGAFDNNFRLATDLLANQVYYIVVCNNAGITGGFDVTSYISADIDSEDAYLVENCGTSKYMDIDGPGAQEWVHQWTAHTGLQEKWTLQRQSDGYYTIRSQYDKKYYVGISSTSTGENNIKLYSSVTDSTRWKIYEDSSGEFVLEPKTATGKVLYVPNSSTGTKLQLSNLSASVSGRNKWNVLKNALSYVNYYDSSFGSSSVLRSYVPSANAFSDFVFTKYFGIGMYMDGSASSYNTVLDDCSTGLNNECTSAACGSECNNGHHKNILTISSQLYNDDREANHLYVLWTDREYGDAYCYEKNGEHASYSAIALVFGEWPVIHFLNIYGSNNSRQLACMAMNIVHETAHTMGMLDVYDNTGHDVNGTECLMERFDETTAYAFYQDVLNGVEDPFCASCMQSMKSHTNNVYFSGN